MFKIEGTAAKASYCVGNDEESPWKTIMTNEEMEYTIPKGEITDNVTIEAR